MEKRMDQEPVRTLTIQDEFWSPRRETNARRAIFHQWEQLKASSCIENFFIAAGESGAFREGWFFADSDAYKWLEAAARILGDAPDPQLAKLVDDFIALLGRAQAPDGYLFTYNQIHFPGQRWMVLQIEHELYCHGHLIEAGISHFEATGRTELLEIAKKAADLIVKRFREAGAEATPGHQEIEIALLRLHQAVGNPGYLEMARLFLDRRGRVHFFPLHLVGQFNEHNRRSAAVARLREEYMSHHPGYSQSLLPPGNPSKKPPFITQRWYLNALRGFYAQQHAPIRKQTIPVGHSVRYGYLQTAAAMFHSLCPDEEMLATLEKSWDRMVARRMYITGGIGSLPGLEGFGRDFELDPEYAYAETCAALACLYWNWEMANITGQAHYSELFEWQLYNAAAPGMGATGERYLYNNPLASQGGVTRRPWYAVPCCPSNLSRTWAGLGRYIFSSKANSLYIHQYIGCQAEVEISGKPVRVEVESGLPWQGRVLIHIDPPEPADFSLCLRLPGWTTHAPGDPSGDRVMLNRQAVNFERSLSFRGEPAAGGYDPRLARSLSLSRRWNPGDVVELDLPMPIRLRRAHPRVKGHTGKAALTRGPLVYCLESIDNPGLDIFSARLDPASLRTGFDSDLLGGSGMITGLIETGQPVKAIPYLLWANRGESQMTVWVNLLV
jgi:uncharacterized protein